MANLVKTICLETSQLEAMILIGALQKYKDSRTDLMLEGSENSKIHDMVCIETIAELIERIGTTCVGVGLFNSGDCESFYKQFERNEYHGNEQNNNDETE